VPSLTVTAWLGGLLVGFSGLREAFVAALHLLPQIERAAPEARRKPRGNAVALVVALAVLLLAGASWWLVRATSAPPDHGEIAACNGSPALCDRRLDQVVFPTSHNSMGGADVAGWMFPNQDAGIEKQLEDGVRGFLIDAHYGEPVGDKVVTELHDEKSAMANYEAALGKQGMDAVLRIRDRIAGRERGARDVYMCHGFCELGALKLVPVLKDVRNFLVENPGEVLVIIIQDEGVLARDIERCFKQSGLIDFVYRGSARPPWPTLREMVETDQRVLVMAENDTTGVPVRVQGSLRVLQPAEPRRNQRFAPAHEPLDRVGTEPQAQRRRDRELARRAHEAHPRTAARARPAAEPGRGRLLRHRRPARRGAGAERGAVDGEPRGAGSGALSPAAPGHFPPSTNRTPTLAAQ
jgi:hypothetical protein